jgi:nucleoside-diphosphate kinase
MSPAELEQTLVLIKPDALKVSLTGYILSQFSEFHTGLRFAAAKIVHVNRLLAEEHYAEHAGKPFFPAVIEYLLGKGHYPSEPRLRRVIAFVFCGPDAVKKLRQIAGPTNPHVARQTAPGTIRALGTIIPLKDETGKVVSERMDNLVHASANAADAEREIKLWFKPNDVMPFMRAYPTETCDANYFYKDGKLLTKFEPESLLVLGPGETAWTSDLETLRLLAEGKPADCTLNAVVAKYLINQKPEEG